MKQAIVKTEIPARVIIAAAQRICSANGVRPLRPAVTVTEDGLMVVRSIYLPRSGQWLANELLDELGLGG